MLADKLTVVTTDVTAALTSQVELASPGVDRGEGVQRGSAGINGGKVLVLTKPVVRCHDTYDHVVYTSDIESAVVDSEGDVAAKEGRSAEGLAVRAKATGHVHVKTSFDGSNTAVNRAPIRHNVTLETKLSLEQTILGCGVLAAVGAVDALVAAHE